MNYSKGKVIKKEIADLFQTGKGKSEIFAELKNKVAQNEYEWLAETIAGLLTDEVREKHRIHIVFLSLLFMISLLIWIYYPEEEKGAVKYAVYLVTLFWAYLIIIGLRNFTAGHLNNIVSLGILLIVVILMRGYQLGNTALFLFSFIPAAAVIFAYQLRKKLFPEIKFWGSVRKDAAGNYIFGS